MCLATRAAPSLFLNRSWMTFERRFAFFRALDVVAKFLLRISWNLLSDSSPLLRDERPIDRSRHSLQGVCGPAPLIVRNKSKASGEAVMPQWYECMTSEARANRAGGALASKAEACTNLSVAEAHVNGFKESGN